MSAALATTVPTPPEPVLGPFTVSIEGLVPDAKFTRLEPAMKALWDSMKVLPLGWNQAAAYHEALAAKGAVENLTRLLHWNKGRVELTFSLEGRTHSVIIRSAAR